MPIYVYLCPECGQSMECLQKLNDPAPSCERCSVAMQKQVTSAGFLLKGSGYYVTDFRDPVKKPASDNAANASAPADSKTESVTKPAAAPNNAATPSTTTLSPTT